MHYRNGREAHNGDKIVSLGVYGNSGVNINAIGILYGAQPGSDYCNGQIAPMLGAHPVAACLCDCLHYDDLVDLLVAAGLNRRPEGM